MRIRPYCDTDLQGLRHLHSAQNFGYPFPDLANPLFLTKLILERQEKNSTASDATANPDLQSSTPAGQGIVGAAILRLTAEAYLLLDPAAGSPRDRWQWLLALHEATQQDAWARGLEDVHAWLPPPIAAKFGRRLTRLGWIRDDAWTPYCKRLTGPSSNT